MRAPTRRSARDPKRSHLLLRCAGALLASASPLSAVAQSITYTVAERIGVGQVDGTITTDGTFGILRTNNITGFSLTLIGNGARTTLASGSARVQIAGDDVTADAQAIYFNFSGSPNSYLLFQQSLFSGNQYWCNAGGDGVCFRGKTIAPQSIFDATAVRESSATGRQVIATAGGASTPTPTPPPPTQIPFFAEDILSIADSVARLAWSRAAEMLMTRYQDRLLTGLNQQVSSCNSVGAGTVFGSIAVTANGRQELAPGLTLLGGVRIGQYSRRGADVELDTGIAASLQYDPPDRGASRPYASLSLAASYQDLSTTRTYLQAGQPASGEGSTESVGVSLGAQLGWVARLSSRAEAAVSLSYLRQWQTTDGYGEVPGVGNPLAATIERSASRSNVVSAATQYTHLISDGLEFGVNASVDHSFGGRTGVDADIGGMQVRSDVPDFTSYTFGARAGLRLSPGVTVDLFVNHIEAPDAIGSSTHGGVGLRLTL